jgi:hypothetical protein
LTVEVLALDTYCAVHGIERIELMKIDIEGGEYVALAGAAGLLQCRAIDCVLFELVDWAAQRGGHTPREIMGSFTARGYRLYTLQHDRLLPVDPVTYAINGNLVALAQPLA